MDDRIPLLFCIDVEPDEHVYPPDDPSPWSGFEALVAESARLRERMTTLTGEPARFVWSLRIDPQIEEAYGDAAWIVDRHRRFFDEVMTLGDAVGVHPHAWRWDRTQRVWFADHEDADWVERCMEMCFEGYVSRFGGPPPHHRFGSRFASERVLATVERFGTRFDLTLEPGEPPEPPGERLGGIWKGEIPDMRQVPRRPYQPDGSDLRRPVEGGQRRLWTIPLTAGVLPLRRRPLRIADRLSHPVRSAHGLARRAGRVLDRMRPHPLDGEPAPAYRVLRLWNDWPPMTDLWDAAFASLDEVELPYLAFAIRSDMEPLLERAIAPLEQHPQAGRLVFTTPEDALARLGLLQERASGSTS
ncbi:MAG TPA: hypothetical protein VFK59_12585 [Actinomycetota bacterium]|nr:hypothetical protein [Actinomycetota bacterium]